MPIVANTLTALAAAICIAIALGAFAPASEAQGGRQVATASPYVAIENEPEPKLFLDPPLAAQLARGVVHIQYRAENVHIVPVFGEAALKVSPRVGHLHVGVDDLPWHWADASDDNTVDIVGLTPGRHTVRIDLVDANHRPFIRRRVELTIPPAAAAHAH